MMDLPGVTQRLDVAADDILTRVFNELTDRGQTFSIENALDLSFVRWSEERCEWIAAPCPREVFEIMKAIR